MSAREVWEKLERRLIKEESYSEAVEGGAGLNEATLRRGVPLPSSHPDPRELDPGEQCGGRQKAGKQGEDNVPGKPATITDGARFHSQPPPESEAGGNEHTWLPRCARPGSEEREIRTKPFIPDTNDSEKAFVSFCL